MRSLTGLRAVAALAVFVFHTCAYGDSASGGWHLGDVGFAGVSFFFVLSGVVLTWSWVDGVSTRTFGMRRFARIYPAHLAMATIAIALYARWHPVPEPVWAVLLTVVLLQAWCLSNVALKAGNGVSWSLSCEAFFYALFPWVRRRLASLTAHRRTAIVAWLAAVTMVPSAVMSYAASGKYDVVVDQFPPVRLADFVIGMVIGLSLREGRLTSVRRWPAWALLGVVMAVGLLLAPHRGWQVPRGAMDAMVLVPFAVLIAVYASRDLRGHGSLLTTPVALYLGRISYCFYLVHQVVGSLVEHTAAWQIGDLSDAIVRALLTLALSVVAAVALHHGVELPMQRRVMRAYRLRAHPAPGTAAPPQSAAPVAVGSGSPR